MNAVMQLNTNTNTNMPKYGIDTCAMLVQFSSSVWTARKLDKVATEEVIADKHAGNKGAARVNKHLLAGRSELEIITSCVSRARVYVYANTLPWSDNGDRLLSTARFMAFNSRMQEFDEEFWRLVEEFKLVYPTLMTAQAMALGGMYNRNDFPMLSELEHKFAFAYNYMPVPTQGDFRVDVGNEAHKLLQEKMEKVGSQRIELAMGDIRERLHNHLKRMSDRLTTDTVDGEEKKRRFHDTVIEGALDLCDLAKGGGQGLNLTDDPELENVRKALESALVGVTAEDVRKNTAVREGLKKDVDAILDKFAF